MTESAFAASSTPSATQTSGQREIMVLLLGVRCP